MPMPKWNKFRFYDFIHKTTITCLVGVTFYLLGSSMYYKYKYTTVRRPEVEEEIRLLREAELAKEQIEKESLLRAQQLKEEKQTNKST